MTNPTRSSPHTQPYLPHPHHPHHPHQPYPQQQQQQQNPHAQSTAPSTSSSSTFASSTSHHLHYPHHGLSAFPAPPPHPIKLLNLEHNEIQVIPPLASLCSALSFTATYSYATLVFLDLYHNRIERITGLDNLPALRVLMLGRNLIQHIENLHALPKLDVLDLHGNRISTIENIDHLKHLRVLNLASNNIHVLPSLALPSLTDLMLTSNYISTIPPLNSPLRKLALAKNDLKREKDVYHLWSLHLLTDLTLAHNPLVLDPHLYRRVLQHAVLVHNLDVRTTYTPHDALGAFESTGIMCREEYILLIKQAWKAEQEERKRRGKDGSGRAHSQQQQQQQQQAGDARENSSGDASAGAGATAATTTSSSSTAPHGHSPSSTLNYREIVDRKRLDMYGPSFAWFGPHIKTEVYAQLAMLRAITIQYVDFTQLVPFLPVIAQRCLKLQSLLLAFTNIHSLAQLDALSCLRLRSLTISTEGNSVRDCPLYRLYAVHRCTITTYLDSVAITSTERDEAQQVFGPLANVRQQSLMNYAWSRRPATLTAVIGASPNWSASSPTAAAAAAAAAGGAGAQQANASPSSASSSSTSSSTSTSSTSATHAHVQVAIGSWMHQSAWLQQQQLLYGPQAHQYQQRLFGRASSSTHQQHQPPHAPHAHSSSASSGVATISANGAAAGSLSALSSALIDAVLPAVVSNLVTTELIEESILLHEKETQFEERWTDMAHLRYDHRSDERGVSTVDMTTTTTTTWWIRCISEGGAGEGACAGESTRARAHAHAVATRSWLLVTVANEDQRVIVVRKIPALRLRVARDADAGTASSAACATRAACVPSAPASGARPSSSSSCRLVALPTDLLLTLFTAYLRLDHAHVPLRACRALAHLRYAEAWWRHECQRRGWLRFVAPPSRSQPPHPPHPSPPHEPASSWSAFALRRARAQRRAKRTWRRIDAFVAHATRLTFAHAASEQELYRAECSMGVALPDLLRASLAVHDGEHDQRRPRTGLVFGFRMLSAAEIAEVYAREFRPHKDLLHWLPCTEQSGSSRLVIDLRARASNEERVYMLHGTNVAVDARRVAASWLALLESLLSHDDQLSGGGGGGGGSSNDVRSRTTMRISGESGDEKSESDEESESDDHADEHAAG